MPIDDWIPAPSDPLTFLTLAAKRFSEGASERQAMAARVDPWGSPSDPGKVVSGAVAEMRQQGFDDDWIGLKLLGTPSPQAMARPPALVAASRGGFSGGGGSEVPAADSALKPAASPPTADSLRPSPRNQDLSHEVARSVPADRPRQPSADLDEIYEGAGVAHQELTTKVDALAQKHNAKALVPENLKGRERSQQKIATDYGGDAALLTDVSRASLVFESDDAMYAALSDISEEVEIVRYKDRFVNPGPEGYRDILLNVKMSNGHVAELQLHNANVLEVKNGEGHAIYEEQRDLQALAKAENRPFTADELKKDRALTERSKAAYDAAYLKSKGVS